MALIRFSNKKMIKKWLIIIVFNDRFFVIFLYIF